MIEKLKKISVIISVANAILKASLWAFEKYGNGENLTESDVQDHVSGQLENSLNNETN